MENLELLHVEDGENPSGFGAVDSRVEVMGTEDREIWLERQQNHLLDINDHDASFFYCEFPPLPDFPCMSSSSSSSSAPVTVKEIACSSSASSASSSSSAASWAVLRLDAEDDVEKRKNNSHHDQQHYTADASTAALSSNGLMEMSQPLDDSMDGVDCMDVMENFGYMDLLDSNDLFDPSSIFHHDESPLEEFQQEQKPQQEQTRRPQELLEHEERMIMLQRKNNDETGADGASEDLAMVFLEWLKTNKETVSAEDLRRVKIKKATIECAAKRLGGGKEGMKQLLKLILEWVQANHLQKRRIKESPSIDNNSLPYQYQPDSFQNHNPNPSTDPFPPPPDSNPCFSQPPWIAQPAYVPEPASVVQGFAPPVAGYMDPFSNAAHLPLSQPPTEYHMLDSAQTWPPSQFALASEYNTFPDNNLQPPPPPSQPVFIGYGHHYPYQCIPGNNDQRTLVRLGSSATKEARKKRMARQRRFSTHHRNHSHHHNQQSQHQNHSAIQHARLGNDNCTPAAQGNTAGSWVYWPTAAGTVGSAPPVLPADASVGPPQTSHHRQSASDRRQGWKSEKNLRFLLQKVLKQSDVGSLGRIVLPKKEAETHLPGLEARDGIPIAMEDIGTSRVWNMRYRFWPNNKSRMYLLENTGDFVRTNGLQEGDFIVLYSDVRCGKYLIRGVKVRQPGTGGAKLETNRPGKSQKNQHANSPSSAAVNGSSPSQKQ